MIGTTLQSLEIRLRLDGGIELGSHKRGGVTMPGDIEPLLNLRQVAERMKISTRLVREHVKEGRLRAVNVGGGKVNQSLRFTSEDIQAFYESRRVIPEPRVSFMPSSRRAASPHSSFLEEHALRKAAITQRKKARREKGE